MQSELNDECHFVSFGCYNYSHTTRNKTFLTESNKFVLLLFLSISYSIRTVTVLLAVNKSSLMFIHLNNY